ncbi:helix-turn-helix domain-containing protein [Micromonospora sp. NPDC005189]|uniref:ArsR/SmtB family transcription factor n=1 Tax=unclassified Micromonospora TaxID=2617518 RepID=UPI0033A13EC7
MGSAPPPSGDALVRVLARQLGLSRALLQVHLRKLAAAGLVTASLELSEDGKTMNYYEVEPFVPTLTPEIIAAAAETLTVPNAAAQPGAAR